MSEPERRVLGESTFMIVWNGAPDSPPASGVREYLLTQKAKQVTTVVHPLNPEDDWVRRITVYERGRQVDQRAGTLSVPNRPPMTYALDPFVPAWPDRVDCWIGFNNLAASRGLVQRGLRRAEKVVYWAVDFVPNRFGAGSVLTWTYDRLDARCCRRVDLRVEVSRVALEARNQRHHLGTDVAPATVAPIGAWVERTPAAPEDGWKEKRVIFLGHLVPRQGVGKLIEALGLLRQRGVEFKAAIAGRGPLEDELRSALPAAGLDGLVEFVGFLSDHREVEAFVAAGSVAVAPYDTEVESFTRYADPSKLRSYTAAGLPIVLTDVPPNAHELQAEAGAEVVPFTGEGLADGIERALSSPADWQHRRRLALDYSKGFSWDVIVPKTLANLGFMP